MRSARKMRTLSILSMAAAGSLGVSHAHGANLSLYYDNITYVPNFSFGNTQTFSYSTTGGDYSQIPTTFNVGIGTTFEFGIDAVVTNNVNPEGGQTTGKVGHVAVQPSFLGLSELGIQIPSTDTTAIKLVPNTAGSSTGSFGTNLDYDSTASLNNSVNPGSIVGPNNSPGGFMPIWNFTSEGDVSPTSANGGDVGDHFPIFQGNAQLVSNIPNGANTLGQYGAAAATFGNATDFFDSLSYTANQPGRVILAPVVDAGETGYWVNTLQGSSTVPSGYASTAFTHPGDVIGTLPILVINVAAEASNQPIISLTAKPFQAPTTYGNSLGTLTVSGHNGNYGVTQLTGLNATAGYVEVNGFNPGTDEEIYALDVLVNGVQANAAQIGDLVFSINHGDTMVVPSTPIVAAATYAGLGVTHDASPFASQYNLFLDYGSGPSSDNFLAIDLSESNDFNLNGYTFSAIAVVPEPMSLSLLALSGMGLLAHRPRHPKRIP
jgi:hypothetical protein